MKIIIKNILVLLISIFASINVLYADDPCEKSAVKDACTNTIKFCYDNKEYNGCAYDEKEPLFATSSSNNAGTEGFYVPGAASFPFSTIKVAADIPLERSYVALDEKNNVGFVGCYKGQIVAKTDPDNPYKDNYFFQKDCSDGNCVGTAYFFKVITPFEGTCTPSKLTVGFYMAEDEKIGGRFTNKQYNEYVNPSTNIGVGNWTPSKNGNCPKYLNFNPSISETDAKNRYVLSDDLNVNYDLNLFQSITNYFTSAYNIDHKVNGCTTQDTVGVEEMRQCFSDKAKAVNGFICPSDPSGYDELKTRFDSYQSTCKAKYNELYSRKLITESSKTYIDMINNAVIQKVDECYSEKCSVDMSKAQEYTKGKVCEFGCVYSARDQSDSPNASCWMCNGSSDPIYEWIEADKISDYGSCHPESSVSKEDCYGHYSEKKCRDCLKSAYTSAGFTEEQMSCLSEGDAVKKKIINDIEESSKNYDEEQIDKNKHGIIPGSNIESKLSSPDVSNKRLKCSEIVGKTGLRMIKGLILIVQMAGAIFAVVKATIMLLPAVAAHDAGEVNSAYKKIVTLAGVLVLILLLRPLIKILGTALGFDISCII